jgi:spore coat polysaccharide biosynthesis predicted glycosyltransferase SpsG
VQQSVTLAKALQSRADISFLTKSSETVLMMIKDAGFPAVALGSDEEILDHLITSNPEVVVFDKIDVEERLAMQIKRHLKSRLIIFTNLTDANKHADVAVTADIGSQFQNVVYTDPDTNTLYYYGPKYWVLRPEFYQYKARQKRPSGNAQHILLMFGGSDPADITSAALDALLQAQTVPAIDIVLGAHFAHDESLTRILERHPTKKVTVTVYRNIKNVAELMFNADLAVTSPGLSVFEALCVGTPVIVIPQDRLQHDTYSGFMRILERDHVSRIGTMIEKRDFTYPDDPSIAQMEIGEGVPELVELILGRQRGKT